jgi:hypothetical protein
MSASFSLDSAEELFQGLGMASRQAPRAEGVERQG